MAVVSIALLYAQPSRANMSISPRLAFPLGHFGDIVDMGSGISVIKASADDRSARVGINLLRFGHGALGSSTALGLLAGYSLQKKGFVLKLDAHLMRISTEISLPLGHGITGETKVKLTPGVGYTMGKLAAEIDYDIAGDWAGVNLYYMLGE